jgi:hypothetical protein
MTFGDVLAVVAGLIGVCISAWTTLVFFSLFFPARADQAAHSIQMSPSKMGLRGFGIVLVMAVFAIALFKLHNPMPTLLAWTILLALLSLAALGGSGLTLLAAARVHDREPQLSAYAALMRGAALVVVPGLLPVFGWFLVAPMMLFVGVGAGTRALRVLPTPAQA